MGCKGRMRQLPLWGIPECLTLYVNMLPRTAGKRKTRYPCVQVPLTPSPSSLPLPPCPSLPCLPPCRLPASLHLCPLGRRRPFFLPRGLEDVTDNRCRPGKSNSNGRPRAPTPPGAPRGAPLRAWSSLPTRYVVIVIVIIIIIMIIMIIMIMIYIYIYM